jgi:V8-like Glu-specific endopeptidase
MRRRLFLSGCALLVSLSAICACKAQFQPIGITRSENIHANVNMASAGLLWNAEISVPGASYLRVFFSNIHSEKAGSYRIRFLNSIGDILLELSKQEFERLDYFVTREIPGSFAEIQVVVDEPHAGAALSFNVPETGFDAQMPRLLSTPASGSDLESINTFNSADRIRQTAEAIARLSIARLDRDGLHKLYMCSGFMITSDLLVTNYHCIQTSDDCIGTSAYFVRANDRGDLIEKMVGHCEELIEAVYSLDIAVVRLGWADPVNNIKVLSIAGRDVSSDEHLSLIGHPNGNALEVSAKNCRVVSLEAPGLWSLNKTDFGHTCSTAEGSSGSPVINSNYEVIGLHHLGFDKSGRWASENRAVKASRFSKLIDSVIETSKSH